MDTRFLLLLGCFLLSGFAALLYQTAWTRELSFVFGTSELAVAAVLAAYMGGLALGAAAAARWAGRLRRPVLAYGVLELAIALSALAVPLEIRWLSAGYVAWLGGGSELPASGASLTTLFQLGAAFAVLLPPTVFMGATLPLLARHAVRSEAEIGSRVGLLYAVNTTGAIAGTLCAAFLLMPALGLRRTVWVGAALNGVVFGLAALLARRSAGTPVQPAGTESRAFAEGAAWILPAIALSGAVSFAYEVLWTRLLGHLLGGSLDAFATMLASFLLGIALGSAVAARLATSRERAAIGFGVSQLGIACIGYGVFALAGRLPELSFRLRAGPEDPLASAALAASALLPITLCIGATFPFAVRLLARSPEQASAATARIYAWNTVGAIAGALGAGFQLLPRLGFEGTVNVCVAASLALALVTALASRPRRRLLAASAAAAAVVLIALPARTPWELLKSSPFASFAPRAPVVYSAVGRSCTVLLFDQGDQFRLYSNGLPEAVIERAGVQALPEIARMLGMLPALVRPNARDLLSIGLGGGTVLESIPSSIRSIEVIELEPQVLATNQKIASQRAKDPLADPRVRVYLGDARGMLQLTEKKWDAIVSQPSHPWTAGASHLYTREFFRLVRSHLKPDGVFVQWIGLNFVDEPLLRSLAAALVEVFGHVESYQLAAAPGMLFAASAAPFDSLASARQSLRENREDLARLGFHRIEDFAPTRLLDEAGVRKLAEGGVPNSDDLNFLAARAARLGDATLSAPSARVLWKKLDPLLSGTDGLDRGALVRRLVSTNHAERAAALAMTEDGAPQETELGWVELGQARLGRAVRHFERALKLTPDSRDALAGLMVSRSVDLTQGKPVEGLSEASLDPQLAAVVTGWRRAASADWEPVAALENELAAFQPGDALFPEASRLRASWRVASKDPEANAEAQQIAGTLLARQWNAADALLYARAAIAAGHPREAWGALNQLARMARRNPALGRQMAAALGLAAELPEDLRRDVNERLQKASAGERPDEEGERVID